MWGKWKKKKKCDNNLFLIGWQENLYEFRNKPKDPSRIKKENKSKQPRERNQWDMFLVSSPIKSHHACANKQAWRHSASWCKTWPSVPLLGYYTCGWWKSSFVSSSAEEGTLERSFFGKNSSGVGTSKKSSLLRNSLWMKTYNESSLLKNS